MKFKNYYISS